ncbi:hypothetical protein [Kluyvera ascorbata]|uniref:hypothetical protein n=1 Tax=Kluyvera ascorbata TaxID=51288 RepID=UPI00127BEF91|nr:hypothetical protein [Kluyvera ascorbata]EBT5172100.1 hypothetical protein [Salmonella enterica]
MSAFRYSARHANAIHVLERLLNKELLGADQIRVYDDQGRVIEYINNKLLVPVERMKVKRGDEHVRVWYLTDQTINDFYYNREQQYRDQMRSVVSARQHRKAVTAAGLLTSLGEVVPESIKLLLAANDDY